MIEEKRNRKTERDRDREAVSVECKRYVNNNTKRLGGNACEFNAAVHGHGHRACHVKNECYGSVAGETEMRHARTCKQYYFPVL